MTSQIGILWITSTMTMNLIWLTTGVKREILLGKARNPGVLVKNMVIMAMVIVVIMAIMDMDMDMAKGGIMVMVTGAIMVTRNLLGGTKEVVVWTLQPAGMDQTVTVASLDTYARLNITHILGQYSSLNALFSTLK